MSIDTVDRLIARLYDAALDDKLWPSLTTEIPRAFKSTSIAVIITNNSGAEAKGLLVSPNLTPTLMHEYNAYFGGLGYGDSPLFPNQGWIGHAGRPAFSQARQASMPSFGKDGYERNISKRLRPVRTSARTVSAGMRVPATTGVPPRISVSLTTTVEVDSCITMTTLLKRHRNMVSAVGDHKTTQGKHTKNLKSSALTMRRRRLSLVQARTTQREFAVQVASVHQACSTSPAIR